MWDFESLDSDGAAPPDAEGWEDVLTQLKHDDLAQHGNGWVMNSGVLMGPPGKSYALLPLPAKLAGASYQLRLKLRELTESSTFHVVLPVGDRMTGFELDGNDAKKPDDFYTGLNSVKGKSRQQLPGAVAGKQVNDSGQHDLEVTVQLDGANAKVSSALDAQPLYEWTGPLSALSQNKNWATTAPGSLALGTMSADWMVYAVKLKRLK